MARRRHQDDNPARFTTGEVAKATGLPVRSVVYLCDQGLLPAEGGGSRATHRELGLEGFARAAVIAPLVNNGIDVTKSARIADGLVDDPDVGVKISNSSFGYLLREDLSRSGINFPSDMKHGEEPYYIHQHIRTRPHYISNTPYPYDHIIEIHDASRIILTNIDHSDGILKISDKGIVLFFVKNLAGKSSSVEIKQAPGITSAQDLSRARLKTLVRVNFSLVTRNAFDRIAEMRE